MNQFDQRDGGNYVQKEKLYSNNYITGKARDFVYSNSNNYKTGGDTKFNINVDQQENVKSRAVTQNNFLSIITGNSNTNTNIISSIQNSSKSQVQNIQNYSNLYGQRGEQNQMAQNGTRINVASQNQSNVSLNRNNDSSLNKRSGSTSRAGIRVTSRNSSVQKKSSASIEKPQGKSQANNNIFSGLNCTRSPFLQNQAENQEVVPNLGSIETLKSEVNYRDFLSDRQKVKVTNHAGNRTDDNFYHNISQTNHMEPSPSSRSNNMSQKQSYEKDSQKIYKNVRQMMENEILVAKKVYEKKFDDEVQSLNLFYRSQTQTLQKVLGENQTLIQTQQKKIQRLEQKNMKRQHKILNYQERFHSIYKFIDSGNAFALQRQQELQVKFGILMQQFQKFQMSENQPVAIQNKLQYIQHLFSDVIGQTIIKYKSIQFEIKGQIKQMMKKYEYFEEKVYEMDLLKHLGKQNQIQNYRLIEKIQNIKEQFVLIQSKQSTRRGVYSPRTLNEQSEALASDKCNNLKQKLQRIQNQIYLCQGKNQLLSIRISQLVTQRENIDERSQKQLGGPSESNSGQIQRLHGVIAQYEGKIQELHGTIRDIYKQKFIICSDLDRKAKSQQQEKQQNRSTVYKFNQALHDKQARLDQVLRRLQDEIREKQELSQALEMTERIFDQQIYKFKGSIQILQNENQQLLLQLDQLNEHRKKPIADSSLSNHQSKTTLRSPNQEVCQTVTMGWFKKNVQKIDSTGKNLYTSSTQKRTSPNRAGENSDTQKQFYAHNQNNQLFHATHNNSHSLDSNSLLQSHPNSGVPGEISKNKSGIQLKHSNSTPEYQSGSVEFNQKKIQKLRTLLKQGNYSFPVECSLDSQNQLQFFQTGIYIIDKNYKTFQLSPKQTDIAQKAGIIRIIRYYDYEPNQQDLYIN